MKIICINGAPGCGKDTLAEHMLPQISTECEICKFSTPLKELAAYFFDIRIEDIESREWKNSVLCSKTGRTGRDFLIDISEKLIKPNLGNDWFAEDLCDYLSADTPVVALITDSGFQIEVDALIKRFGAEAVGVIQIHRSGYTYDGDSREYVTAPIMEQVFNTSTLEEFFQRSEIAVNKLLERLTHV